MTGSSGDAARDRMQPPAFWRDLGAEFQGLPDSVWANRDAPDRLHMSDGEVRGGDASLRARFKDIAGRGGMALCAERGLERRSFRCPVGVGRRRHGVSEGGEEPVVQGGSVYALEAWSSQETGTGSCPRFVHDTMSRTTPWTRPCRSSNAWVERIQREGIGRRELLSRDGRRPKVCGDRQMSHEDLKYWAVPLGLA